MPDFGKLRRYLTLPSRSAARIRRDVDDELRMHIDLRTDALQRAGLSGDDARAQAIAEFGDIDDATRFCSAVDTRRERRRTRASWFAEARQDSMHAFRILRRSPAFAAATILTLAIAIGASIAVYGVLHAYLIRPLPFPEPDRLVSVLPGPSLDFFPRAPSLQSVDWTRVDSLFDATAAWDLDGFTIPGDQHAEYVDGAWVSAGFFRVVGLQPVLGRGFRVDEYRDHAPVALISHDLWMRRFGGDKHIIGTAVTAHSTDRPREQSLVTVIGVLPEGFWHLNRFIDVLRPLPESRMPSLARLRSGVSMSEAQSRLDAVVRAQITDGAIDPAWHMSLLATRDEHTARVRPILAAVFGAALFMLLAACGSVAGALVSRMASRRNELAIRMALGGSTGRILRQILTESGVLATIAGGLGLIFAWVLLRASGPLIETQLATPVPGGASQLRPDLGVMLLAIAISTLAGVGLGLVPSLVYVRPRRHSAGFPLLAAVRGSSVRTVGARVRRFMIAGQIAVAMVLLFGAGLMFRTITRIANADLGFRADGVMKATLLLPLTRYPDSTARRDVMDRVLTSLAQTPGVRSVAAVFPHPFRDVGPIPVAVEGVSGTNLDAAFYTVSGGYFEAMRIRLLGGRAIRALDNENAPLVAIVSEGLARSISSDGTVLGRRIRVGSESQPWRTIVGVANDTKKGFASQSVADVYVPYAQNPRAYQSIVVRTDGDVAAIVEPVRRAVAALDPVLALADVEPLAETVARQGSQRRGMTLLLGMFSLFALALSALGLYSSLSYTVVQRRAELALRMAVGADARAVLRLIVGEGLRTAGIGLAVGAIASVALGRVLESQLYGVSADDPLTLAGISAVLAIAALASCVIPGRRAARTDPASALRE